MRAVETNKLKYFEVELRVSAEATVTCKIYADTREEAIEQLRGDLQPSDLDFDIDAFADNARWDCDEMDEVEADELTDPEDPLGEDDEVPS